MKTKHFLEDQDFLKVQLNCTICLTARSGCYGQHIMGVHEPGDQRHIQLLHARTKHGVTKFRWTHDVLEKGGHDSVGWPRREPLLSAGGASFQVSDETRKYTQAVVANLH